MLVQWSVAVDDATSIRILRDGELVAEPASGATSFEDRDLGPNTRYAYKIVVGRSGAGEVVAEASSATFAHPPQGADSRSVDWSGFQFYIVDERNPGHTEYLVRLRRLDGAGTAVSDWNSSKCRVFDGLSARARYGYSVMARNLDGIETVAANRRAGEGVRHPESFQTRSYQSSDDPWVAARVSELAAVYGLTDSAVDWLSNGIRIEWKRGLPGWAGFLGGGYVGIGHSGPGTLMHESMHGFWGTWDGWQETCDRMNFYTFKRDQAQFILDFREYDRSGQPNPWEAWRPYYKYLLGVLKSDISEGVSFWEALEDRAFYKIGGFYHQQETIFPAHAARKLSLVPPPLQKYFRGFLEEGENRTWAEELDWYSRLEAPDHHLWNLVFATRDLLWHSPELGAPGSAARTRIPEQLRDMLRTADRQRLVDFVNTLEDVERSNDSDPDSGFWRGYLMGHLFISQFYLPELDRSIGIEAPQPTLDSIREILESLVFDLYCGVLNPAEVREVITNADNISQLQRTAFLKMVEVYERGERFSCVSWSTATPTPTPTPTPHAHADSHTHANSRSRTGRPQACT